jgi:hypothetical protein
MTIIGSAVKWAVLAPFVVVAIVVGMALAFASGWGLVSIVTDNESAKMIGGMVTITMGLGAWIGAASAR